MLRLRYAEAAERWAAFPSVPQRAFALLGLGRCRLQLGHADATAALTDAREVFVSLQALPLISECADVLAEAIELTS